MILEPGSPGARARSIGRLHPAGSPLNRLCRYALILFSVSVGCSRQQSGGGAEPSSRTGELVFLYTNDMHGHFLPDVWGRDSAAQAMGGFENLDALARSLRRDHGDENLLILDGGDIMTGTPLSDMVYRGVPGAGILALMEMVGYDAWVLGNHDMDRGWDATAALVAASPMPVLSCNLAGPEGGPAFPGQVDHVVLDAAGLQVGIVGVTTEDLFGLNVTGIDQHVVIYQAAEAVGREAAELDGQVDYLVLLSHLGLEADKDLAAAVPRLDLIIGGHSHDRLERPVRQGDTWIVQAGSYTRAAGVLRVETGPDGPGVPTGELTDLVPRKDWEEPSPELRELVSTLRDTIQLEYGAVAGRATASFHARKGEPKPMGWWAARVLKDITGADAGLINSGGLRSAFSKGPITKLQVYQVFPFGNQLVTFQLSGSEFSRMLDFQDTGKHRLFIVGPETDGAGDIRQTSAATSTKLPGLPLDAARSYTLATNIYVAKQWRRYLGVEPRQVEVLPITMYEAALKALANEPASPR